MINFSVYTDGACKGNPGKGGYAYIVYDDKGEIWIKGRGTEEKTTNNKMEITAAIEALRMIDKMYKDYTVSICSDSAYLVNCFNDKWINTWEKNGWKNSNKKDVLNKELWETLNELVKMTGAIFKRISRKEIRIKEVDKEANIASLI